jgi:hypothetical protein
MQTKILVYPALLSLILSLSGAFFAVAPVAASPISVVEAAPVIAPAPLITVAPASPANSTIALASASAAASCAPEGGEIDLNHPANCFSLVTGTPTRTPHNLSVISSQSPSSVRVSAPLTRLAQNNVTPFTSSSRELPATVPQTGAVVVEISLLALAAVSIALISTVKRRFTPLTLSQLQVRLC